MQHIQLDCENARPVTTNEATVLRLPSLSPVPSMEEWQHVLHQAADILEHLGWCRGLLKFGTQHCAVGAIIAAFKEGDVPSDDCLESFLLAHPTLQRIIFKVEAHLNQADVMTWNDKHAPSGAEVASALRATAAQN
jgi:hypothetical protein